MLGNRWQNSAYEIAQNSAQNNQNARLLILLSTSWHRQLTCLVRVKKLLSIFSLIRYHTLGLNVTTALKKTPILSVFERYVLLCPSQMNTEQLTFLYLQGRDLQCRLEEAFLSGRNGFRFRIADQDYQMNFNPSSNMSQTNVKYGTTREVRRRPAKIISKCDISELKRYIRNQLCLYLISPWEQNATPINLGVTSC